LTLNYVEHILKSKEKLEKKKPGIFTDDGFAMGLCYILAVLDQSKQFDSLHWFENVEQQFRKKLSNVDTQTKEQSKLAIEKITTNLREFQLLKFSYYGAKVFWTQ